MGEFLEYIRGLHAKLSKSKPKKIKIPGRTLDHDSISEVTDLSEEGILTTSMQKLSEFERKRLKRYMMELRLVQSSEAKKHNCGQIVNKGKGSRRLNN